MGKRRTSSSTLLFSQPPITCFQLIFSILYSSDNYTDPLYKRSAITQPRKTPPAIQINPIELIHIHSILQSCDARYIVTWLIINTSRHVISCELLNDCRKNGLELVARSKRCVQYVMMNRDQLLLMMMLVVIYKSNAFPSFHTMPSRNRWTTLVALTGHREIDNRRINSVNHLLT